MTHLYNDPAEFKNDVIKGFAAAYPQYVQRVEGASGFVRAGGPLDGQGQPGHRRRLRPLPVLQRCGRHRLRRRSGARRSVRLAVGGTGLPRSPRRPTVAPEWCWGSATTPATG